MANKPTPRGFTRRDFLKLAGQGVLLGVLAKAVPAAAKQRGGLRLLGGPQQARPLAAPPPPPAPYTIVEKRLVASDGFVNLPGRPAANDLYVFGFREVLDADMPLGDAITAPIDDLDIYKGFTQYVAPVIGVNEGEGLKLILTNIGLVGRPDLDDSHTIHWHGFRNPLAYFDGVPELSVAVPVGRDFPYFFRAEDAGTYMYHCHFEDVEHIQMGMDGIIFIRPAQNGDTSYYPSGKYVYNDATPPGPLAGSTGYDREYALVLNEIDTRPHDGLIAVQEFLWSDYKANYWGINGRSYPDTILPDGDSSIPQQPISALIKANAYERVLLRVVNFGYEQHAMILPGITMKVVGEDATLLRGPAPDYLDLSYETDTLFIGPGETRDVLFTAPGYVGPGAYDTYYFKNRSYQKLVNPGAPGPGGMMTEVHVYPTATLPDQTTYP
jgi:FtsP/CotA-like multicopper oxidase with cupredoxin domain